MTREEEFAKALLERLDGQDALGLNTSAMRQRIAEVGAVAAVKEYLATLPDEDESSQCTG